MGAVCANRWPGNTEVAWTRDEVLVGSVYFRNHFVSFLIHIVVLLLVYHGYWKAAPNFVASGWLGEGSPFFTALNSRSVVSHCGP